MLDSGPPERRANLFECKDCIYRYNETEKDYKPQDECDVFKSVAFIQNHKLFYPEVTISGKNGDQFTVRLCGSRKYRDSRKSAEARLRRGETPDG